MDILVWLGSIMLAVYNWMKVTVMLPAGSGLPSITWLQFFVGIALLGTLIEIYVQFTNTIRRSRDNADRIRKNQMNRIADRMEKRL